jgi:hypothetical protein
VTLDDIKDRCRVEGEHWVWAGALSAGVPRVWAPDFTLHGGEFRSQTGNRAVWHVKTGKAIPKGWRVFGSCDVALCMNPECMTCEPPAARGRKVAASGKLKGQIKRIVANRAIGRKRSVVKDERQLAEIITSAETGVAIARRLGVPRQTVSKARTGQLLAFAPVGGIFTALLASSDSQRRGV